MHINSMYTVSVSRRSPQQANANGCHHVKHLDADTCVVLLLQTVSVIARALASYDQQAGSTQPNLTVAAQVGNTTLLQVGMMSCVIPLYWSFCCH